MADSIPLEGQDLYCARYGISFWCDEQGVRFLENLQPDVLAYFGYINEYAFSDDVRYIGTLKITDIGVKADLTDPVQVEAIYKIKNPGDTEADVHIMTLGAPEDTEAYENGKRIDVDPELYGWYSKFAPGEEKEVKLVFSEPLYGDIFGYNVNLRFDERAVDNHITPVGTFKFILPANNVADKCLPAGYTTGVENGRMTVSWKKSNFVPWTNPFNDLICTWKSGAVPTPPETEPTQKGQDNTPFILLVLVAAIIGALYYLKRTERLDDIIERIQDNLGELR